MQLKSGEMDSPCTNRSLRDGSDSVHRVSAASSLASYDDLADRDGIGEEEGESVTADKDFQAELIAMEKDALAAEEREDGVAYQFTETRSVSREGTASLAGKAGVVSRENTTVGAQSVLSLDQALQRQLSKFHLTYASDGSEIPLSVSASWINEKMKKEEGENKEKKPSRNSCKPSDLDASQSGKKDGDNGDDGQAGGGKENKPPIGGGGGILLLEVASRTGEPSVSFSQSSVTHLTDSTSLTATRKLGCSGDTQYDSSVDFEGHREPVQQKPKWTKRMRQIYTHHSDQPFIYPSDDPFSSGVAIRLKYGDSPYLKEMKLPKQRIHPRKAPEKAVLGKLPDMTKSGHGEHLKSQPLSAAQQGGPKSLLKRHQPRVKFADFSMETLNLNQNCAITTEDDDVGDGVGAYCEAEVDDVDVETLALCYPCGGDGEEGIILLPHRRTSEEQVAADGDDLAARFSALEAELCAVRSQIQDQIMNNQTDEDGDNWSTDGHDNDDDGFVYEDDGVSDDEEQATGGDHVADRQQTTDREQTVDTGQAVDGGQTTDVDQGDGPQDREASDDEDGWDGYMEALLN
nr:hypothetical protein BaRGS_005757 [Batillaria attramentaria]